MTRGAPGPVTRRVLDWVRAPGWTGLSRPPSRVPVLPGLGSSPGRTSMVETFQNLAARERPEPLPALGFRPWIAALRTGDGAYEETYNESRRRLMVLALALLDGPDDLDVLQDQLWSICDEYSWCLPARLAGPSGAPGVHRRTVDDAAARTAGLLAEVLDLLGDRLDRVVADRVAFEVRDRVLVPLQSGAPAFPWERAGGNTAAVCAANLIVATQVLEEGPRAASALVRCAQTLDAFWETVVASLGAPGALEPWAPGWGAYLAAAEVLQRSSEGAVDLLRVVPCAGLPPDAPGPVGLFAFSNQDAPIRLSSAGRPAPGGSGQGGEAEDQGNWCPDAQQLVVTSSLGRLAAGASPGETDGPFHLGSFRVSRGVDVYLDDFGRDNLGRDNLVDAVVPGLAMRSEHHSLPLVDGRGPVEGGPRARATFDRRYRRLTLDLGPSHGPGVVKALRRTFQWSPNLASMTLADVLRFADQQSHQVVERFVTPLMPRTVGCRVCLPGVDGYLVIQPETVPDQTHVRAIAFPSGGRARRAYIVEYVYENLVLGARLAFRLGLGPQSVPESWAT